LKHDHFSDRILLRRQFSTVIIDGKLHSNIVASQAIHQKWGGVVPELASRAHQQHIVPVVAEALATAKITKSDLNAIAFTREPGLWALY
jgi:N6-L-threonylcarbamoyladenine synthase